jgi:hypothetical protein
VQYSYLDCYLDVVVTAVHQVAAEAEADREAAKTKRYKKDPKAPTRARSAYMFFYQEKFAELRQVNPELKPPEAAPVIGALWKDLKSKKNRTAMNKYKDLAAQDAQRYQHDLAAYQPTYTVI